MLADVRLIHWGLCCCSRPLLSSRMNEEEANGRRSSGKWGARAESFTITTARLHSAKNPEEHHHKGNWDAGVLVLKGNRIGGTGGGGIGSLMLGKMAPRASCSFPCRAPSPSSHHGSRPGSSTTAAAGLVQIPTPQMRALLSLLEKYIRMRE
jgi:hypothetical protein